MGSRAAFFFSFAGFRVFRCRVLWRLAAESMASRASFDIYSSVATKDIMPTVPLLMKLVVSMTGKHRALSCRTAIVQERPQTHGFWHLRLGRPRSDTPDQNRMFWCDGEFGLDNLAHRGLLLAVKGCSNQKSLGSRLSTWAAKQTIVFGRGRHREAV